MSTTESRLDELRKYRMKNCTTALKNEPNGESTTTNGSVNGSASKMKMATGRKRIRVISVSDSSGDEDSGKRHPSKIPNHIQNGSPAKPIVAQREQRLADLKHQFPSVDTMILQNELVRVEWDLAKAIETMKHKDYKPTANKLIPHKPIAGQQNGHHSSHASHSSNSSAPSHHKVRRLYAFGVYFLISNLSRFHCRKRRNTLDATPAAQTKTTTLTAITGTTQRCSRATMIATMNNPSS